MVPKAIPRKQGQGRDYLRTYHLFSILTEKGREKVPRDQSVWKILELEASAATQKLNSRAPSSFWQKDLFIPRGFGCSWRIKLIYLHCCKDLWGKLEMCLVLDKISKNLQPKWMGQMHSSLTNSKLKPQMTLKAHDRAQHSIYVPKLIYCLTYKYLCLLIMPIYLGLQRLLKLTTDSKNWHSLKHEIGEQATQSCVQCRFLEPNFCWSSPAQEFLSTRHQWWPRASQGRLNSTQLAETGTKLMWPQLCASISRLVLI